MLAPDTPSPLHLPEHLSLRELICETLAILIPADLSSILLFSAQTVTLIFVGHRLGEIGVSQYSAGCLIFNVAAMSITTGLGSAIDTIGSQAFGQNPRSRVIGETLQRTLAINFFLGFFMSIGFLASRPLLLWVFGEEVGSGAATFLSHCPLYLAFQIISVATTKTFFAQRLSGLVAAANAASALSSPIANYIFTGLGIEGAAMALTCNSGMSALVGILFCVYHPKVAVREAQWPSPALLEKDAWVSFLRVGIPSLVAVCAEWWAFEVQALFANFISPTALAVFGVSMNIIIVMFSLALGVSVSASVIIGNALGARNHKLAKQYAHFIVVCDVVLGVCVAALMGIFGGHIARLYTNVPELAEAVEAVMPLVVITHIGDSFQYCLQGIFRGAGRPEQAANGVLLTMWLIGMPATAIYVFVFKWGVKGVIGGLLTGIMFEIPFLLYLISQWDWKQLEDEVQKAVISHQFEVAEAEDVAVAADGETRGSLSQTSFGETEEEEDIAVEGIEVVEVHPHKTAASRRISDIHKNDEP